MNNSKSELREMASKAIVRKARPWGSRCGLVEDSNELKPREGVEGIKAVGAGLGLWGFLLLGRHLPDLLWSRLSREKRLRIELLLKTLGRLGNWLRRRD